MTKGLRSLSFLGLMTLGLCFLFTASTAFAGDGTLTILATSDMHSVMKPYGPYSSETDEYMYGGYVRLAERIIEKKIQYASAGNGVLVLDSGDTVAGTFFHYAYKGVAEIALMSALYDATTLGNHEFDWTPDALAGALQNALQQQITPVPIVSSNILDWGDSPLQGFKDTLILPYLMKETAGINVGIFGLMTKGTAALGQSAPLQFSDLSTTEGVIAALGVAGMLQQMGADVIVLLAHNGLSYDYQLAQAANAYNVKLDLIISGHDHTPNPSFITVGNTRIVQVGAYTEHLGRVSLTVANRVVTGADFHLESIDTSNPDISGEPTPNLDPVGWATLVGTYNMFASPEAMALQIAASYPSGWNEPTTGYTWGDFSGGSEQDFLIAAGFLPGPYSWQTYNLNNAYTQMLTTLHHAFPPYGDETADEYIQVPAQLGGFDLALSAYSESNLGDLISDSLWLRGALVDLGDENNEVLGLPGAPNDDVTDFALEAGGTIRFDLPYDDNGITLSDAYQVLPLGIGIKSFDLVNGDLPIGADGNPEVAPGFDLIRFYMTGADLKTAMELGAAAPELGDIFFLNWSGLTFDYDLSKELLERVSNAKVAGYDIVDAAVYKGISSTYLGSSFLLLPVLLEPALNAELITQEQYDRITAMRIYLDRGATMPVTDIMDPMQFGRMYAGKEWLAFCDKIMWPWWYSGLNGIVGATYAAPQSRMVDVTPSTARVNLSKKGTKFYLPNVIANLLGKKAGQNGYIAMYDLNRDGIIDNQDLNVALR